jgi:F-type H+-transporting ATPase subunit gamma
MRSIVVLATGLVAVSAFQGSPVSAVTSRHAAVTMGSNVKELRERVTSVKNTKKITSAMKLVAAAKVRRAQEAVIRSRPFSETLERILGGLLARLSTEALDIPLMETREAKNVAIVVVTGDRGLCGGYNAQMIKKAEARIIELKDQGVGVELVTVGNKGSTYFKKRQPGSEGKGVKTTVRAMYACGQGPTAEEATTIANELLSSYYAGEVDRIELMYTSFISMINSVPSIRTIIPLTPAGIESEGDEIFKLTTKDGQMSVEKEKVEKAKPAEFAPDMIFEQEPSQLLNALLPPTSTASCCASCRSRSPPSSRRACRPCSRPPTTPRTCRGASRPR